MVWDDVARQDHRRVCARYPSDMTDREWAIIAPLLPPFAHRQCSPLRLRLDRVRDGKGGQAFPSNPAAHSLGNWGPHTKSLKG